MRDLLQWAMGGGGGAHSFVTELGEREKALLTCIRILKKYWAIDSAWPGVDLRICSRVLLFKYQTGEQVGLTWALLSVSITCISSENQWAIALFKYGVWSPKFILGSCVHLYSLAETPQLPLSPRIWAHMRGRYWSAKITAWVIGSFLLTNSSQWFLLHYIEEDETE